MRLALVTFLIFSACAADSQDRAFQDPASFRQVTQSRPIPCDLDGLTEETNADAKREAACVFEAQKAEWQNRRWAIEKATRALFLGQCSSFFDVFGSFEELKTERQVLAAGMLRQGLCVQRNLKGSVDLLESHVSAAPRDYVALAHLGQLYWTGDGVSSNEVKAKALFKRAKLNAIPDLILEKQISHERAISLTETVTEGEALYGAYWHLYEIDLITGFADPTLGPWSLPAPLRQARTDQDDLLAGGDIALLGLATRLLTGEGETELDPVLAAKILERASNSPRSSNVQFQLASWLLDPQIRSNIRRLDVRRETEFSRPNSDSFPPQCWGFDQMRGAAIDGHSGALNWLIQAYKEALRDRVPLVMQAMEAKPPVSMASLLPSDIPFAKRELIEGYHDLVYSLYVLGYAVPKEESAVLSRLLDEKERDPSISIRVPSVGSLARKPYCDHQ